MLLVLVFGAGPSVAHCRAFGSKATTYKDVGVDLNSKGG